MRVIAVCGMGMGTSLMLFMEIQSLAKKHGFKIEGEATDLGSAMGKKCDFYVASAEIANQLKVGDTIVVGINNIIDKKEIESKVLPVMQELSEKGV